MQFVGYGKVLAGIQRLGGQAPNLTRSMEIARRENDCSVVVYPP
jgi:hypothetical protein